METITSNNSKEESLALMLTHLNKITYGDEKNNILKHIRSELFKKDWAEFCNLHNLQIDNGRCSIENINTALKIVQLDNRNIAIGEKIFSTIELIKKSNTKILKNNDISSENYLSLNIDTELDDYVTEGKHKHFFNENLILEVINEKLSLGSKISLIPLNVLSTSKNTNTINGLTNLLNILDKENIEEINSKNPEIFSELIRKGKSIEIINLYKKYNLSIYLPDTIINGLISINDRSTIEELIGFTRENPIEISNNTILVEKLIENGKIDSIIEILSNIKNINDLDASILDYILENADNSNEKIKGINKKIDWKHRVKSYFNKKIIFLLK